MRALAAFILFVVSEGMEVTAPNVLWDEVRSGSAFESSLGENSSTFRAIVTASPLLGNILGAVVGGAVADTHGRHSAILLHSALFACASMATALSHDTTSLVTSRVVLGVSLGIIVPVLVSYMAELAPSLQRARAVVIIPGFGFPCGQIVMLMSGLLLNHYSPDMMSPEAGDAGQRDVDEGRETRFDWWRILMVAGIIPNFTALLLVYLYVPESPHFLLSTGEPDTAERVLRQIARANDAEHRLLQRGRIGISNFHNTRKLAPPRGSRALGGNHGDGTTRARTGRESKLQRWQRQGAELLSPPLHTYMLLLLGMCTLAGAGQFGADIMLPKMLEGALHLDLKSRLTTLLCITILSWPAFVLVIYLLEQKDALSRRFVCACMAAASCIAGESE